MRKNKGDVEINWSFISGHSGQQRFRRDVKKKWKLGQISKGEQKQAVSPGRRSGGPKLRLAQACKRDSK